MDYFFVIQKKLKNNFKVYCLPLLLRMNTSLAFTISPEFVEAFFALLTLVSTEFGINKKDLSFAVENGVSATISYSDTLSASIDKFLVSLQGNFPAEGFQFSFRHFVGKRKLFEFEGLVGGSVEHRLLQKVLGQYLRFEDGAFYITDAVPEGDLKVVAIIWHQRLKPSAPAK